MTTTDPRNRGDDGRRPLTALRDDEPMTDELCLFVLTLAADGRHVSAELLARARAHADAHPSCRDALGDLDRIRAVLGDEPVHRPGPGFTERVLAAAREERREGRVLPMMRQVAAAAALILAVSLFWVAADPGTAEADPSIEDAPHAVDGFRPAPYGPDDLDAGLQNLLPNPAPRASAPPDELSADSDAEVAGDETDR